MVGLKRFIEKVKYMVRVYPHVAEMRDYDMGFLAKYMRSVIGMGSHRYSTIGMYIHLNRSLSDEELSENAHETADLKCGIKLGYRYVPHGTKGWSTMQAIDQNTGIDLTKEQHKKWSEIRLDHHKFHDNLRKQTTKYRIKQYVEYERKVKNIVDRMRT
jgi:hypothetical protein